MREIMEFNGYEIEPSGRCFCPFHVNVNTPAAKFFDEGNDLRCFAESKTYKVFDLMKVFNWDEDRIRGLLPDDISYDYGLDDKVEIFVPVVTEQQVISYNDDIFALLQGLDEYWKDKDNVECRVLNR